MKQNVYKPVVREFKAARDLARVVAIEQESFARPWVAEDFLDYGRTGNQHVLVAVCQKKVVGYVVYEVYGTFFEVLNIAVDTAYRRIGVATEIMKQLHYRLGLSLRGRVMCYVPVDNDSGRAFFQQVGFRATNTIAGKCDQPDMIRFMHPLGG